jgi:hypothetical protein
MLRPVIMIGCGGAGTKTVRYVREAVQRRLRQVGWDGGVPDVWQFIGIDAGRTQEDVSISALPTSDHLSLDTSYHNYLHHLKDLETRYPPGSAGFAEMLGWRPGPSPSAVGIGQLYPPQCRAVDRASSLISLNDIVRSRVLNAFVACTAGGPELAEVSRKLGVIVPPGTSVPLPLTLVVGSMAGGTGAGIMLDVVDLLRRSHVNGAFPVMVAFTPDIFGTEVTDFMTANSAAFVSEFLSAYWDDEGADSALVPAMVQANSRGPHSTFIVGRRNMDGFDLCNSKNVYRAVGDVLAAVTTSARFQDQFFNFSTVAWSGSAPNNGGGYDWHENLTKAALSSFGGTTLSIGRDRFREYLSRLLHRSIVEHLTDGFNQMAVQHLGGDVARSMSGEEKVAELARLHQDEFAASCGLLGMSSSEESISDFVSHESLLAETNAVTIDITNGTENLPEMTADDWSRTIRKIAIEARGLSQQRVSFADPHFNVIDALHAVVKSSTDFAARLSFPVVLKMIDTLRADVLKFVIDLQESAEADRRDAQRFFLKGREHLENLKEVLASSSSLGMKTIDDYATAISLEWSAKLKDDRASHLKRFVSGGPSTEVGGMLDWKPELPDLEQSNLEAVHTRIQGCLARLVLLTTPQDGNPAIVSMWPNNDWVVPANFAPSPVEVCLEDHENWPLMARQLLELSLGDVHDDLPMDPVHAARMVVIRGGFTGGSGEHVGPLIGAEIDEQTGVRAVELREVGRSPQVRIIDGVDELEERINSWLLRPGSASQKYLTEGLSAYLSPVDPETSVPTDDHLQRLSAYESKLREALVNSRPLIEIDRRMYATVHSQEMVTTLNVQGFPFGEGHPARAITAGIVQGFLHTPGEVDWIFTGGEAESVLISSFLRSPVNPSVISSFTVPFAESMSNVVNEDLLRSSFWLWRRARTLPNFIPLPPDLRIAAIRGFAIARSLGYCTATVNEPNRIVDKHGTHLFPKFLLTNTNANNVLPALLESMILTFADAPMKGKHAFDAYGALISYGVGGGLANEFLLSKVMTEFLNTGDHLVTPVDQIRSQRVLHADFQARKEEVLRYVDNYLRNLYEVAARPPARTHWRNSTGSIEPTDTLLLELMDDLVQGFTDVRNAVQNYDPYTEEWP